MNPYQCCITDAKVTSGQLAKVFATIGGLFSLGTNTAFYNFLQDELIKKLLSSSKCQCKIRSENCRY